MSSAVKAQFETKENQVTHYRFHDGVEYFQIKSLVDQECVILDRNEMEGLLNYFKNS